eukprot:m.54932 g.54932  ORF g.54932 m.54932 type:complete len:592 (-) comp21995_c0_seq1:150-1925(-)
MSLKMTSNDSNKVWRATDVDTLAGVKTSSAVMAFMDVDNSGIQKLVLVDYNNSVDTPHRAKSDAELKVWQGGKIVGSSSKRKVIGIPSGMVAFHMDEAEGGRSACAVASGDTIYILVNLKAYAKFTLPALPLSIEEESLWKELAGSPIFDADAVCETLQSFHNRDVGLSARSIRLLALSTTARAGFIDEHRMRPLKRKTTITSMGTVYKSANNIGEPECLVAGTEEGDIFVLSPKNFSILERFKVPSAPVVMSCQGVFDIEYRIMLAGRDGFVYRVKGKNTLPIGIELPAHAVGLVRVDKNIYVGCMNDTLSCFSPKGKRMWSISLPAPISTMGLLSYRPRNAKAVIVALANGEVRLYNERTVVDSFTLEEPVVGLVFGKYGADAGVLAMATASGKLHFRYIQQGVDFSKCSHGGGPPPEQSIRIPVPPKTQLYVDQTQRERDNAMLMHRTFQRDLFRLKLMSARNYVKALQGNLTPIINSIQVSLRINTEVQGLGPLFKVTVTLINTTNQPVSGITVAFTGDHSMYSILNPLIKSGMLIPAASYTFSTPVKCLTEEFESSAITVIVCRPPEAIPLLSTEIQMPIVSNISV